MKIITMLLVFFVIGCGPAQGGKKQEAKSNKESVDLNKCFDMTKEEVEKYLGTPTRVTRVKVPPDHTIGTDLMYKKKEHKGEWPLPDGVTIINFDFRPAENVSECTPLRNISIPPKLCSKHMGSRISEGLPHSPASHPSSSSARASTNL
ncbi:hypothetical protein ACFL1X_06025 [Candidatus Hydrogenedentota bacterium]